MGKYINPPVKNLPSRKAIREYWAQTDLPARKEYADVEEFLEETDACFACGFIWKGTLHRAHIKPECKDGPNTVENLHLLCRVCHRDSEFLEDEYYWSWFWQRSICDRLLSGAVQMGLNSWSALKDLGLTQQPNPKPQLSQLLPKWIGAPSGKP